MTIRKRSKFVILLILSLVLTAIASLVITKLNTIPQSTVPMPRMQSHSWMSLSQWFILHAEDVELAERGEGKILFLGDSITQGWSETKVWEKHLQPLQALNFGIGGDLTQNLLWRLENGAIGNLKPERIILAIGTNNLYNPEDSPKDAYLGISVILDKLKNSFPEAKILLMGILPKEEKPEHPNRAKIIEVNQNLQSWEKSNNITYIDIAKEFLLLDKTIAPELMPDFLHLSERGYEIWLKYILEWINYVP